MPLFGRESDELLEPTRHLLGHAPHVLAYRTASIRLQRTVDDRVHPLTSEEIYEMIKTLTNETQFGEFKETGDADFAYEMLGWGRFRSNYFMDLKGPGAVFRLIPSEILTAEMLKLPKAVLDLCYLSKGLVVVTGPGSPSVLGNMPTSIEQHVNWICAFIEHARGRGAKIIEKHITLEFNIPNAQDWKVSVRTSMARRFTSPHLRARPT